jgi:hypothetical protein
MMARETGSGVGRGYGPGSVKGQFKTGMPSKNPNGRPRKPKREPDASFKEAAHRELSTLVDVFENGVRKSVPLPEAMLRALTAGSHKHTPRNQAAIIRLLIELAPTSLQERSPLPSPKAIKDFVQKLADEHRRDQEAERLFGDAGR